MADKMRTLWAIDLNGSPLNQFSGNEFEIFEDSEGKVNISIDNEILTGAILHNLKEGGNSDISDVKVNGSSVVENKVADIKLKTINNQAITGEGNINISGGDYIIVNTYSDLPTTDVSVGMLAYVQDISGGDNDSHFFIYKNNFWESIFIENEYAILNTNESFAIQTYTFDSTVNFNNILEYQTIVVLFYDTSSPFLAFSTTGITLPNSGNPVVKLTNLIIYENKQYLAVLELRGGTTTNNATLSFQEIEGGGGSGSSDVQLKYYHSSFKLMFDETPQDDPVITEARRYFDFIFNVSPKQAEGMIVYLQEQGGITISTWSEALEVIKTMVLQNNNSLARAYTLALLLNMLNSQGIGLVVKESYYDNTLAEPIEHIVSYRIVLDYNNGSGVQYLSSVNNNQGHWKNIGDPDFDLMTVTITTNSEDFVYDEFTVAGGGSSDPVASGSGKLYVYDFTLKLYDDNGEVQNSERTFKLGLYESNFERFKEKASDFGITLNTPEDIRTLLNMYNSTTSVISPQDATMLLELIANCDLKYYMTQGYSLEIYPVYLGLGIYALEGNSSVIGLSTIVGGDEVYYGINTNNSCTLTEYGTSGGSSAEAGIPLYKLYLKQTATVTLNRGYEGDQDFTKDVTNVVGFEFQSKNIVSRYNDYIGLVNTQYSTSFSTISNENEITNSLKTIISTLISANVSSGIIYQGITILVRILSLKEGITTQQFASSDEYTTFDNNYYINTFGTSAGSFDTGEIYIVDDYYCGVASFTGLLLPIAATNNISFYSDPLITSSNQNVVIGGAVKLSLVDNYDLKLENIGSTGSSSGNGSTDNDDNKIDFLQLRVTDTNNSVIGNVVFTIPKGYLDTQETITQTNQMITLFNTQYSLSIPAYTSINSLEEISDYLNTLSSSYNTVAIIFYSGVIHSLKYNSLSVKGYVSGQALPVWIDSNFDSSNDSYSYSIKYINGNESSFAFLTLADSTNYTQMRIFVNDLD